MKFIFYSLLCSAIFQHGFSQQTLFQKRDEARRQRVITDLQTIESALIQYGILGKTYPSDEQGLSALIQRPKTEPTPKRWTQSLDKLPKDPWGRVYRYKQTEKGFMLCGPSAKLKTMIQMILSEKKI